MTEATFDDRQHADTPGWATYNKPKPSPWWRRRRRCAHAWPAEAPETADGFSPSNYARCSRCGAPGHWYVVGQHRYGGVDRYFAAVSGAVS